VQLVHEKVSTTLLKAVKNAFSHSLDPLPTFMNTLYDGKNFLKAGVRRKFE
jgi:hypothetical protein